MSDDRISIAMIMHNRGDQIQSALKHLLQLSERPRLIVVDNGSTDRAVRVARSLSHRVEVSVSRKIEAAQAGTRVCGRLRRHMWR